MENTNVKGGTLVALMKSSSSEIMKERGNQVLTNIHSTFKQKIDASFNRINELKIKKTELLHKLVPSTTIQTAFDVNTVDFVDKNVELVRELANEELWFGALKAEYFELFDKEYTEPESFF